MPKKDRFVILRYFLLRIFIEITDTFYWSLSKLLTPFIFVGNVFINLALTLCLCLKRINSLFLDIVYWQSILRILTIFNESLSKGKHDWQFLQKDFVQTSSQAKFMVETNVCYRMRGIVRYELVLNAKSN